jgi:hypothetical protein
VESTTNKLAYQKTLSVVGTAKRSGDGGPDAASRGTHEPAVPSPEPSTAGSQRR